MMMIMMIVMMISYMLDIMTSHLTRSTSFIRLACRQTEKKKTKLPEIMALCRKDLTMWLKIRRETVSPVLYQM